MKLKRTIISIVALMLAVCLMPTALAATWYLEDGDITVIADENGQSVKQGSNSAVADSDTVITQRDSEKATDNTITVSTVVSVSKGSSFTSSPSTGTGKLNTIFFIQLPSFLFSGNISIRSIKAFINSFCSASVAEW